MPEMNQDILNRLASKLPTQFVAKKILFFEQTASTNDVARELFHRGPLAVAEGTTIIAAAQTKGRGQFERSWHSPPRGGVYLSVILKPPLELEKVLPCLSLMAGSALAEALEDVARVRFSLKYPNDLYLQGKKIAGILTESLGGCRDDHHALFVVLGIGVNLSTDPSSMPGELQSTASSVFSLTARKISSLTFIRRLGIQLEKWYGRFLARDFAIIVDHWRKRMETVPEEVEKKLQFIIREGRDRPRR